MIWNRSDYWLEQTEFEARELASRVYRMVVRRSFDQPGFAIIACPASLSSRSLRAAMWQLKQELSRLFCEQWHQPLEYLSLGRFDQQTTTKLHLDGAPDRSILMLGYEPTEVVSEFIIADYTASADAIGLTPGNFLSQHNPMFAQGLALLEPYTPRIGDWSEDRPRMVVVNNSSTVPGNPGHIAGVLHGASIPRPDATKSRIINSTMIAVPQGVPGEDHASVQTFLETDAVSGPILRN